VLYISAVLFKISWVAFRVSKILRLLNNRIELNLAKQAELLKLRQSLSTNVPIKAQAYILSMQSILQDSYGEPWSSRAVWRTLLHSLGFCCLFSLLLGIYLFESFSGLIEILTWPKLLVYFLWISILVSLVTVFDVAVTRTVLNYFVVAKKRSIKLFFLFLMLLPPLIFFLIATALVAGTAMNSLGLADGRLGGYWSLHFLMQRLTLLINNPFADVTSIRIISTGRFVQPQVLTWFAGVGSLTVFSVAAITVFAQHIVASKNKWRFLKLQFLNKASSSKTVANCIFGGGVVFFCFGILFLFQK
jgi:hypothetical protein